MPLLATGLQNFHSCGESEMRISTTRIKKVYFIDPDTITKPNKLNSVRIRTISWFWDTQVAKLNQLSNIRIPRKTKTYQRPEKTTACKRAERKEWVHPSGSPDIPKVSRRCNRIELSTESKAVLTAKKSKKCHVSHGCDIIGQAVKHHRLVD